MEDNSMWLSGNSIAIPDPFQHTHKDDVLAENAALRAQVQQLSKENATPLSQSQLSQSQQPLGAKSQKAMASLSQNANPNRRRLQSLAMCEGGSSASMLGGSADEGAKAALEQSQSEIKQLKELLASEKATANLWRERAAKEREGREESDRRLAASTSADELSQATNRIRSLETELDHLRQTHDGVVAQYESKVKFTQEEAIADMEAQRKELDGRMRYFQSQAEGADELRAAFDAQGAQLADLSNRLREAEDGQFAAEANHRHAVGQLKEEHTRALFAAEAQFQAQLEAVQREAEARVEETKRLSGRLSGGSGDEADSSLSVSSLKRTVEDLQAELQAKCDECDAMATQFSQSKRKMEIDHQNLVNAMETRQQEETKRLIADHCEEIAEMKSRASFADKLEDRVRRTEQQLSEARSEVEEAIKQCERNEAQLNEMQRLNARCEQERRAAVEKFELISSDVESMQQRHAEALREERALNKARIEELMLQVKRQSTEHEDVENDWDDAIRQYQDRIATMEADFLQKQSEWSRERQQLMSDEHAARSEVAALAQAVDADRGQLQIVQARVDFLESEVATAAREKSGLAAALDDARRKAAADAHTMSRNDMENASLKAKLQSLEKRLENVMGVGMTPARFVGATTESLARPSAAAASYTPSTSALASSTTGLSRKTPRSTMESANNTGTPNIPTTPTLQEPPFKAQRTGNSTGTASSANTSPNSDPLLVGDSDKSNSNRMMPPPPPGRIFAVTGFDHKESIHNAISALPGSAVVECKPNMPVPPEATHLISTGQLTVKLLTALVRGCWLLPERYVRDSLAANRWLDEGDYGHRHQTRPLAGRTIAFTTAFKSSRHYDTCRLVAAEGQALLLENPTDITTAGRVSGGIVMCTPQELATVADPDRRIITHPTAKAMTWDLTVKTIYNKPLPVASGTNAHGRSVMPSMSAAPQ